MWIRGFLRERQVEKREWSGERTGGKTTERRFSSKLIYLQA